MRIRHLLSTSLPFLASLAVSDLTAEGNSQQVYREIAQLAATDRKAAVAKLQTSTALDPEGFYLAFESLDFRQHFLFLQEVLDDPALANRFVIDFASLTPEIPRENGPEKNLLKDGNHSFAKVIVKMRNDQVIKLLNDIPEEVDPLLVIPTLWNEFQVTAFVTAIIAAATHDSAYWMDSVNFTEDFNRPIPKDDIPQRFHEILGLMNRLTNFATPPERKDKEMVMNRMAEMVENSELPLTMQLGFAGMGTYALEPLPPEAILLAAGWLNEAREKNVPVGFQTDQRILKQFLFVHPQPEWKPLAQQLLASRPESSTAGSYPWMVGLAAALGDHAKVNTLLAHPPEHQPGLTGSPLLPLLIRAGFQNEAAQIVAEGKEDLVSRWTQYSSSFSGIPYDSELEANLPEFLQLIGDNEVRFVTELHLASLKDHSTLPPMQPRDTRMKTLARRLNGISFNSPSAQLTALNLIGKFPQASAEIADLYLNYAQFDRVERHLTNVLRADQWVDLCDSTLKALIEAGRYDDALMILQRVKAATANPGISQRLSSQSLWEKIATTLLDAAKRKDKNAEDLLPVLRLACSEPDSRFPENCGYLRYNLIKETIIEHETAGRLAAWWKHYRELAGVARRDLNTVMVRGLAGKWIIESGEEDSPPPPGISTSQGIVEVFTQVPHDAPLTAKLEALQARFGPDTPKAIVLVYQFRYLSAEEILESAEQLTAALPEGTSKWSNLARVAFDANRRELADKYLKRSIE